MLYRRQRGPTRVLRAEASSLKLLKWNIGVLGEQKDIPILIPHGGAIEAGAYKAKGLR